MQPAINKICRDCGCVEVYFSPSGCDWHCAKCTGFAIDMTPEQIERAAKKPCKECEIRIQAFAEALTEAHKQSVYWYDMTHDTADLAVNVAGIIAQKIWKLGRDAGGAEPPFNEQPTLLKTYCGITPAVLKGKP